SHMAGRLLKVSSLAALAVASSGFYLHSLSVDANDLSVVRFARAAATTAVISYDYLTAFRNVQSGTDEYRLLRSEVSFLSCTRLAFSAVLSHLEALLIGLSEGDTTPARGTSYTELVYSGPVGKVKSNSTLQQSGKGYKAISKALGLHRTTMRAIIHKWGKHGTVVNLPRSAWLTKITPRVQRRLIQEITKDPITTSKELQASLASVKVSVHDSAIKRLGKNGLHGPGRLAVYEKTPKENVRPSVCDLKLKGTWVLQQDDDPKHTSKSTSEWLKQNEDLRGPVKKRGAGQRGHEGSQFQGVVPFTPRCGMCWHVFAGYSAAPGGGRTHVPLLQAVRKKDNEGEGKREGERDRAQPSSPPPPPPHHQKPVWALGRGRESHMFRIRRNRESPHHPGNYLLVASSSWLTRGRGRVGVCGRRGAERARPWPIHCNGGSRHMAQPRCSWAPAVRKASAVNPARRERVHKRSAERLRALCCANRGTFIKVGQHLGALDYLLPEEYTSTLKVLHSSAPQSTMDEVQQVLREDLGKESEGDGYHFTEPCRDSGSNILRRVPPTLSDKREQASRAALILCSLSLSCPLRQLGQIFVSFQEEPEGAASLAQVHRAVLANGSVVAVKVQHPKVQAQSSRDIAVMEFLLQAVHWLFPDFAFMWLVEEAKRNMPLELDFLNEGRNAERVADMLKHFDFLQTRSCGGVASPTPSPPAQSQQPGWRHAPQRGLVPVRSSHSIWSFSYSSPARDVEGCQVSNGPVLSVAALGQRTACDRTPTISQRLHAVRCNDAGIDPGREARRVGAAVVRNGGSRLIMVPKIHWDLSSRRVLTMDFAEGGQVNDRAYMQKHGIDVNEVSRPTTGLQKHLHVPRLANLLPGPHAEVNVEVRQRPGCSEHRAYIARSAPPACEHHSVASAIGVSSGPDVSGAGQIAVVERPTREHTHGCCVHERAESDGGVALAAHHAQISRNLGKLYSEMIFVTGFVHCDPHPGNVLVRKCPRSKKAKIVLLDHGLYQVLNQDFRMDYCRLWQSLIKGDMKGVERHSRRLGAGDLYPLFACILTARSWTSVSTGISHTPVTHTEGRAYFGLFILLPSLISTVSPNGCPGAWCTGSEKFRNFLRPRAERTDALLTWPGCGLPADWAKPLSPDMEIRTNAALYLPQISELLNKVPRQMLLLLKTNDLLRGIETVLQTRASSSSFLNMSRCCTRALARSGMQSTRLTRTLHQRALHVLFIHLLHVHQRSKTTSRTKRLQISLAETISLWQISLYELMLWTRGSLLARWIRSLLNCLPHPY
ncbi:hypothetical protein P4O66_011567, partial [Electrophorus voltai]